MTVDMSRPDEDLPQTTMHVARAVDGDVASLEWLVGRLSPLLRAHATFRLGTVLRRHHDPDDLVNDAWLALLPRLQELLRDPGGRRTPVLLKYMSNTVVLRIRHLARHHARQGVEEQMPSEVTAAQSGAITRALRQERDEAVRTAINELEERDREVVLLRGIEQLQAAAVAAMLEIGVEAVHKRYQRALDRLRRRLPSSVFDELHVD